ncbi:fibroblast growth factor receptor 3-like isoform X1 [Lytechinus pictus]|uniref:fibroblast growth factor receptor 3-like isoform X1 n=2 Tax=Lytechinus pictus TaxID=7653 RepID=UPI0030B9FC55
MLLTIDMTMTMAGLVLLRGFAVLLLVIGTNGQTATVTGTSLAAAGTDATLTCDITGGTVPVILWVDDNTGENIFAGTVPITDDEKFKNFDVTTLTNIQSVMTISSAEVTDDGIYRCEIQGTDGSMDFVVEVPGTLTGPTVRSFVSSSGEDMYEATCEVVGGKPPVNITCYLNGVEQTNGNGKTIVQTHPTAPSNPPLSNTKSVFTFPATQENHLQTLECRATGYQLTELERQESTDLDIHTSPSTAGTTVTAEYVTYGTDNIRVTCTAQNEPSPIMRNYYILSNGTLIHESMNTVKDVTVSNPEAGTEYTCMAGNYLGNTSISAAVTYEQPRTTNLPPTTETTPEPTPCPCAPSGLSSGAYAGIAILAILLVASIIINIIQFILLRRKTKPEFHESKNNKSNEINIPQEMNDNVAYEMIQSGNRAYTALKLGSTHSFVIARENVTFFTRLGSIGRGDFGEVWKGDLRSKQNHLDVAIRQIPDHVTKSLQVLQAIKVLYELSDQPNIVKCLGYCKEQGSILYEFISGGTLLTHLQTSGVQSQPTYSNLKPNGVRIEEGTLLNLAWQVAKGMQFLASKKIIHGALCAHNVLVGERKQCKISDYGLSSSLFGDLAKPSRWSSPETMATGDQTIKGDIWSFGIVLWEIVTLGARPYPNMTFSSVQTEVANGYQIPRPRHCAQEVYAVMTGCWDKEPQNRSNFDHILKSMERILEKTHSYLSLNDLDDGLYASTLEM